MNLDRGLNWLAGRWIPAGYALKHIQATPGSERKAATFVELLALLRGLPPREKVLIGGILVPDSAAGEIGVLFTVTRRNGEQTICGAEAITDAASDER